MNPLLEVKRSLTVLDLVFRDWARELALDECGVMVVLLLAEQPNLGASDLALRCGRARQQAHRSLLLLESQGRVECTSRSPKGRIAGWALTEDGLAVVRCLHDGLTAWNEELSRKLDLNSLAEVLNDIVVFALNRKSANGWIHGLFIPRELRKETMRTRASDLPVRRGIPPVEQEPAEAAPKSRITEKERAEIARIAFEMWQ
jgi:DNA-binding MarR family transcriptional regulator